MHVLHDYLLSVNWKALSCQKKAFSFYMQTSLGYSIETEESPSDGFQPNKY